MVLSTAPLVASADETPDVRISEVLVSASSEDYDGVDWNGDGYTGSTSDQFIEIWNAGSTPVDVSDWWLDDEEGGGSPPCRLPWDTVLEPNARIVVFRADSGIELDYYGGDSAILR
ncbi:MAG TPA: lamin tail domain-containing protein, partial [Candidatus Poseidoniales archaeon]